MILTQVTRIQWRVARKGMFFSLLTFYLPLLACQSPVITLTGNQGSNTSTSIVGSQDSSVATSHHHTADNTGSGPNLSETCLPGVSLSGSPIGDFTSQPTCASPSPSASDYTPPLLSNPIPGI